MIKPNQLRLDEIMEMRDGGFKYQRNKVGLSDKGNNDLADRIFYSGDFENVNDIPILIGKDIDSFFFNPEPQKKLRHNYIHLLNPNESTYFNQKIMKSPIKLIWRQTAEHFLGVILDQPIFFGNTIQDGIIKAEYLETFTYEYLACILNSKLLRYYYTIIVQESGRVFPQVKLEKLRNLPIVRLDITNQSIFVDLYGELVSEKRMNNHHSVSNLLNEIDHLVYTLYGLDENEIAKIENSEK